MRIEFDVADLDPQPPLIEHTRQLIAELMTELSCPADLVDLIVIADENRISQRIEELSGEPATNNRHALAIGKAIPGPLPTRAPCRIVIFAGAIDRLLARKMGQGAQFTPGERLAAYALAHEIGHCLDVVGRTSALVGSTPLTPRDGKFRIAHLAKRYSAIVIDEFEACFFAARRVDQATFDADEARAQEHIRTSIQQLQAHRAATASNRTVALVAGQLFWVILVEYGKLIGHFTGNAQLAKRISTGSGVPSGVSDELLKLIGVLQRLRGSYSAVPPNVELDLTELWRSVGTAFKYSFSAATDEDQVAWTG